MHPFGATLQALTDQWNYYGTIHVSGPYTMQICCWQLLVKTKLPYV